MTRGVQWSHVPRSRSSHKLSEPPDASFGFKAGTSKNRFASVLFDSEVPTTVPQTVTHFGIRTPACFIILVALIALAGCSHFLFAEREPWRGDAEIACLNTGAVKETPQRVRISAISGPGICGMDYPLRIAALGDNPPLAYNEAIRSIRRLSRAIPAKIFHLAAARRPAVVAQSTRLPASRTGR